MRLRDVTEHDLPAFFEHQREPAANAMALFPPRDREVFIRHWRTKVLGVPANLKKTIEVDGEVAGNIVSWEQDGIRLVGYWIASAYWGRGVATAALAAFVKEHETHRPLFAHVAVSNVGSIRVLEKCGFRCMGEPVTGHDGVEEFVMRLEASEVIR